ncbi:outer membrane protein OmpA-like peptidoglycan-associated protein [Sulfitobacter undariae]|uniref:Outer membrane protein OmpA-like peptidoglycan-associated protein n=2 Tax=Sulfitobacter undariae TaxID=1563671 RepID=A0A7W6E288_9RHOB|nr:outer membrane protein OmpA-like peptidoglycan-associated protein [Sulfitobacter undariae]
MLLKSWRMPLSIVAFAGMTSAAAADSAFTSGWMLQPQNSVLSFQTIKNDNKVELSSFLDYEGQIDENGEARVTIRMDSVDTKVDLRNVRLRFLLFETFDHPTASITLQVPPEALEDLRDVRRKRMVLPYTLELVGIQKQLEAEVIVTLIDYNTVAVASAFPISILVEDFELTDGLRKLEQTAEVDVIPSATVSFNFAFGRNTPLQSQQIGTFSARAPVAVSSETSGTFNADECATRFDALSRSGRITFASNSATLDAESMPLLSTLTGIVARCTDMSIQVSGHTDSTGSSASNQELSESRARTVVNLLMRGGISANRLSYIGLGEAQPIADNETTSGRERNRRIEFKITSGS